MSSNEKQSGNSGSGNSESGSLDIFSPDFDAAKALFSPAADIPVPSAPIYDNIEAFMSKTSEGTSTSKSAGQNKKKHPEQSEVKLERQFLPEQMPIPTKRKELPNLLRFMEKQSQKGGPFGSLAKCVTNGIRVKVHLRGINKIRGFAIGTLVAFDKHWNLALVDVDETFSRKRFPKNAIHDVEKISKDLESLRMEGKKSRKDKKGVEVPSRELIGNSRLQVVKTRRKSELCERHMPQVMLRGEHVALVQIL